jgi:hypothetical protein
MCGSKAKGYHGIIRINEKREMGEKRGEGFGVKGVGMKSKRLSES